MKPKTKKIITTVMSFASALWIVSVFLFFVFRMDHFAQIVFAVTFVLPFLFPPLFALLIVIDCFYHSTFSERHKHTDVILYELTTVLAATFGAASMTVLVMLAFRILSLISGAFTNEVPVLLRMSAAFALLFVLVIGIGWFFCRLIRIRSTEIASRLRTAAVITMLAAALCVLMIPIQTDTYNDGGTRVYSAVLYDVVDWNRIPQPNGTQRADGAQEIQVYFFPENCYDYDTKWTTRYD